MNTIDWGICFLFLLGFIYGYLKGFVRQAIGLLGIVASLFVAYSFSRYSAGLLQRQFPLPEETSNSFFHSLLNSNSVQHYIYTAVSFLLLFVISRIMWSLFGKLLDAFSSLPIISFVNRWSGALLGCVQVFVLIIVIVNVLAVLPNNHWKEEMGQSKISNFVLQLSPFLSEQLKWEHPKVGYTSLHYRG
jgi:uncharacterized membrane protein required for colicin V production